MANYAIFRAAKLKTHADATNVLKEQMRADDYESKRADPSLSERNTMSATYEDAIKKFDELLPKKRRKNAVIGLNFVVSASQEFEDSETEKKFYEDARKFIGENFGEVVAWAIHRDETATHMQVVSIPLVDGKLNARKLIGGDKHRMEQIQTAFYEEVGKKYGLERGQEKSQATHKTVEEKHRAEEAEIQKKREQAEAELQKAKKMSADAFIKAAELISAKYQMAEEKNALDKRKEALESLETKLNDKELEINEKGRKVTGWVNHAKENSLEILHEVEKSEENRFYFPAKPFEFFQKVKACVTGAWALVKGLTDENENLKTRLKSWRSLSPSKLEEIAGKMKAHGCENYEQLEEYENNQKREAKKQKDKEQVRGR